MKEKIIAGLDCASSGHDFTALVIAKLTGARSVEDRFIEVLDVWRDRELHIDERIATIEARLADHKVVSIAIETNGLGAFYQEKINWRKKVGVATTAKSKAEMIERVQFYLERRQISLKAVADSPLPGEIAEYSYTKSGKLSAPSGKHDDCLMALSVGLHGHQKDLEDRNLIAKGVMDDDDPGWEFTAIRGKPD